MDFFVSLAENFIGMFEAGGESFTGFVTGLIPKLITLILFVNALIKLIGEERVFGFMQKCTKFSILRYTLVPFLAMFFLTNPMAYTFGRFVKEEYKAAWFDSCISMCHPVLGLFPHANSAELFVYLGIAEGFAVHGNISELAVRYILVGFVVIFIRGMLTERIYAHMAKKNQEKQNEAFQVV